MTRKRPPILAEAQLRTDVVPLEGDELSVLDHRMLRLQRLEILVSELPLLEPVARYRVSSRFGKRKDPVNSAWSVHHGLDLTSARDAPILAAGPGRIVHSGEQGRYGRLVEIDHGNGVSTRYGHLSRSLVRPGSSVAAGEKIGLMGSSGRSTGVHLLYEVRVDGKPRDPQKWIDAGRAVQAP